MVVEVGRGTPGRGRHQVDYAVDSVAADHVKHLEGLGHIHPLDEQIFAHPVMERFRQTQG